MAADARVGRGRWRYRFRVLRIGATLIGAAGGVASGAGAGWVYCGFLVPFAGMASFLAQ
jgi:hypothetical protein